MTLRTTAIIAGVLGLLMAIAGLISHLLRADHHVVAATDPSAAIVVVGPEVLALPGVERIAVTAEGGVQAHSARTSDAAAWLEDREAVFIIGYETWETLATSTEPPAAIAAPSPEPSASASSSPSASASASPSPSASRSASPSADASGSPSASASPSPGAEAVADGPTDAEIAALYGAGDSWRQDWRGEGRLAVTGVALAPGEALVFFSEDGSPLESVEFFTERPVNDTWIAPLIWIGAALALLGGLAAASSLIDVRPLQARLESRRTSRQAEVDAPTPGSRRQKRLAGAALPEVDLEDAPTPPADQAAPPEAAAKAKAKRAKPAVPADGTAPSAVPPVKPTKGSTE